MVATDLFELKGDHYLLAVDYFSQYSEVYKLSSEVYELSSTMSNAIIAVLKSIFTHYGIAEILWRDNGPQYASKEFPSSQSYTSSTILPAVQGFHKVMDKWKGWYRQSKDC